MYNTAVEDAREETLTREREREREKERVSLGVEDQKEVCEFSRQV